MKPMVVSSACCDGCGKASTVSREDMIRVGQDPALADEYPYERNAVLCSDCIVEAAKLWKEHAARRLARMSKPCLCQKATFGGEVRQVVWSPLCEMHPRAKT